MNIKINRLLKSSLFLLMGVGILVFSFACRQKIELSEFEKTPLLLSDEVKILASEIANDNYIGTESVSRKPGMDPAYARRHKLMRIATDSELLALTGDPNAVVSLIAFEGLYKRGNSTVPSIFEGYQKRSESINYLQGDMMMEIPLLEYAYVYVMNYQMPNEEPPSEVEFSDPKFAINKEKQKEIVERIDGLRSGDK